MKFTDRFIKVPIYQVNPKEEELTGKEGDRVPCNMLINPRRVESFNETIPQSEYHADNKIWTSVTMESGDNFVVRMKMDKFEKLLNDHHIP